MENQKNGETVYKYCVFVAREKVAFQKLDVNMWSTQRHRHTQTGILKAAIVHIEAQRDTLLHAPQLNSA